MNTQSFSQALAVFLGVIVFSTVSFAEERQITATFMIPDLPTNTKEVGASAIAALNDVITLAVTTPAHPTPVNDSRWIIHSIDSVGTTIKARHPKLDDLNTEGHFVFVCCTVENLSDEAMYVPPVILVDSKERRFTPLELGKARPYLPKDYSSFMTDLIQPGLSKKICIIFELPKEVTCNTLEIYPLRLTANPNLILLRNLSGKIVRASDEAMDDLLATAPTKTQTAIPEKAASIQLKGTRTVNSETTINRHVKSRTQGYNAELKLSGPNQLDVTMKAYFIGENDRSKMVIAETTDKLVTLTSDKPLVVNFTSAPVNQNANIPESLELKGVIIQVWSNGAILASYTSQFAWKKFAEMPDLLTQLEYDPKRKANNR